jgi:zinc D-Ala-D-Ala dipeptidase
MFHVPFPLRSIGKSFQSAAFIITTGACIALVLSYTAFAKGRIDPDRDARKGVSDICELEQKVILDGLVDVNVLDPSIMVDLVFATPVNFIGENVYGTFTRAYLRPKAAKKLVRASEILQERHPHLRLLVVDALRPRSVQHVMWDIVAGTPMQRYIANPYAGSMHNYGTAVDVTLFCTQNEEALDMGTPFHYLGSLAQPILENQYLRKGRLNEQQIENRRILRNAMREAGWYGLNIEWWHFDAFPRDHVRRTYTIIE